MGRTASRALRASFAQRVGPTWTWNDSRDCAAHCRARKHALASLRIDHVHEDRADLVARFRRRRSVLFVATGLGMSLAFAYFLVRAGLDPASARDLWIACGAAVTAVAGSGWLAQALLHGSALTQCRRLDRRIAEEQVLAGLEPSLPEPSRVRIATDRLDVTPIDAEPTLADARTRATAR